MSDEEQEPQGPSLDTLLAERPDVEASMDGVAADGSEAPQAPPSPTALELDDWSVRRGYDVFHESEPVQKAFQELGVPEDPSDTKWLHSEEHKKIESAELATADFHAAAFEPDHKLAENPKDERISRYMKNLVETPEFQELHQETCLDEESAEMAAAHFAKQWVEVAKQEEPEGEFEKDMQCLQAASGAVAQAQQDVGEWNDAKNGLGIGSGDGTGSKLPKEEVRKRFEMVRNSRFLQRICQLAGRYRRMAQAMQRKKVLHGQDDLVGVTLGDTVSALVPSELAQLADEDLEMDAMRRVVEASAMVRDFRGVEKVAKGPIVVVVDESGSMDGEPICNAKSFALAMYWIARHQKRWCCLVGFSSGPEGNYLVIPPGEDKSAELMEWLEHFYAGGTSPQVPCVELPKKWEELGTPSGRTDILVVTDGLMHIHEETAKEFNAWKRRTEARFNVICVGESGESLRPVADRIWSAETIDVEEAAFTESMAAV